MGHLRVAPNEDLGAILHGHARMHIGLHGQCVAIGWAAGEPGVQYVLTPRTVVDKDKKPQCHGCDSIEAAEDDVQVPPLGHSHGSKCPQSNVQGMSDCQSPELHLQGVDAVHVWAGHPRVERD